MVAYYNENDPNAAAWLRELIKDGDIASHVSVENHDDVASQKSRENH